MNLERLSNELLLDLFEFLSGVHLLGAFSSLNCRFDRLLIGHFRIAGLDLRSISKTDFDLICRDHFPSMIEHITRLRLSDDHDTPHQIDLLFTRRFPLPRFVHLQFLSIYRLSSFKSIGQLVKQCRDLLHLTDLQFIQCSSLEDRQLLRAIVNGIWRLSKLTHCHLDFKLRSTDQLPIPTVRSKSIESLVIEDVTADVSRLIRSTPRLRHLSILINNSLQKKPFPSSISSLTSLKVFVKCSSTVLVNLLRHLPNLIRLTMQTSGIDVDGRRWGQIIVDYLPKLKVFRFEMCYTTKNTEDGIDQILRSYRTPFWLVERQWFVRCRWEPDDENNFVFLYSLPYGFHRFVLYPGNSNTRIKSTSPNDEDYSSYNRVTSLDSQSSGLNELILPGIRFNHVQHLDVVLPFSDRLLSALPRFDRLISLAVSTCAEVDADLLRYQLQILIDRAPRLSSMTLGEWSKPLINILLHLTSPSIRHLDLLTYHYPFRDRCFTDDEFVSFLHSPLAAQCGSLEIAVEHRHSLIDILDGMKHLRALKVQFQTVESRDYRPTGEERFEWILSGASSVLTNDRTNGLHSRFWIR